MARIRRDGTVLLSAALFMLACTGDIPMTSPKPNTGPMLDYFGGDASEEEIFGSVYLNGQPIPEDSVNYYVTLDRLGQFHHNIPASEYEARMWVNPHGQHREGHPEQGGWMYGWYGLTANDGPCKTDPVGQEVHNTFQPLPNASIPPGPEKHCVYPGEEYLFTLWHSTGAGDTVVRRYEIVFPAKEDSAQVPDPNAPLGKTYKGIVWDSAAPLHPLVPGYYRDVYISVELITGVGVDTPNLVITNAGEMIGVDDQLIDSPSGSITDYFIINSTHTTSTSNIVDPAMNSPNARVWIGKQGGDLVRHTTFLTPVTEFDLVWKSRLGDLEGSGTYDVKLEVRRPDSPKPLATDLTSVPYGRSVAVSDTSAPPPPLPGPRACFNAENFDTWRYTDQELDASCTDSQSSPQYSWRSTTNSSLVWGSWSAPSNSPTYQFSGHGTAGVQKVQLKVETAQDTLYRTQNFDVQSGLLTASGQTYVTSKGSYTYIASSSGYWFDRYPPTSSWSTLGFGGGESSSVSVIWPAVQLRGRGQG